MMGGLAVAEARNRVGRRHELEKREKVTPKKM
jgi:hypothetical protein